MAAPATAVIPAEKLPRERSMWTAIPSWIISLALHAALLATFAMTLESPAIVGDPLANDREVGIYFRPSHESHLDAPGERVGEPTSPTTTPGPAAETGEDLTVDEAPPVTLDLPSAAVARIGPGPALPSESVASDARQMIKSTGTRPATAGNGPGSGGGNGQSGGGTTFFGQKAAGSRFVYVIDASGSMHEHNALGVAKSELLASLAQLDSNQQFQIIFYSEKCYPMSGAEGKPQLFWGTDVNRTKASQFVRGIEPLEGTRHRDALLNALLYSPDVIYFLTDAGEPRLEPADLDRIKRRNNGRAQIHAIEFGKGANLNIETNFVRRLARENGGGYVYRDIQKFRRE
ncbi:MAG TPA: hypothetical protein VL475_07495 [Planctomycetaceae bacterium]|jgi:hypothetical protein|nr:hypothetical protein [Planctomycetaceae bacterium]